MTGRHNQSDLAQSELIGLPLSRGALIRAAADGELSPAQRAELDPTLTEAESRAIEAEVHLRQAVGKAMGHPAAPAGLRDRILAAAAVADEGSGAGAGFDADEIPAPIPMAPWARGLAVAAAMALVAGGAFMFMRDGGGDWGAGGAGSALAGGGFGGPEASIQLVELRQFVSREHNRCERDPARVGKFVTTELTEVPERFRPILGDAVSIEEILQAKLTLKGAGQCGVPGEGSSVHLLLGSPECSATVSVFVQQDAKNRLKLEEGASYELTQDEAGDGDVSIVAWRRDGLTYYLVAEPDACGRIREAMGRTPCIKR